MESSQSEVVWKSAIDSSGRVSVPADARKANGWMAGTKLIFRKAENGRTEILTLDEYVKEVQDYFSMLGDPNEIWSDEIIEARRKDAVLEAGRP